MLPDGQERGVEDAAGFVGLFAFVSELGLDVVPATQLVAVLPASRQRRDGASVHEARDAFEIGLLRGGVRHIFELLSVGHLDLHESCPAFRVGNDRSAIAAAVDGFELLPTGFVCELDARSVDQLGLDLLAVSARLLLVLGVAFLALPIVLGLDASVACLLRVREDRVWIGADALADVTAQRPRPIAIDELGVGIRAHADGHAVEVELHRGVESARQADGFGDRARDVGSRHDINAVRGVVDLLWRAVDVLQLFHVCSPVLRL